MKLVFDVYLKASIHVAFSILALTQTTVLMLKIPKLEDVILGFIFFGTIVFYNAMKYYHLNNIFFKMRFWKPILCLTLFSLLFLFFCFSQMSFFKKVQVLIEPKLNDFIRASGHYNSFLSLWCSGLNGNHTFNYIYFFGFKFNVKIKFCLG